MPEQPYHEESICNKSAKVGEWKKYSVKSYVLSVKWGNKRITRGVGLKVKGSRHKVWNGVPYKNRGFMVSDYSPVFLDPSHPAKHFNH